MFKLSREVGEGRALKNCLVDNFSQEPALATTFEWRRPNEKTRQTAGLRVESEGFEPSSKQAMLLLSTCVVAV